MEVKTSLGSPIRILFAFVLDGKYIVPLGLYEMEKMDVL